jgi:hypothetical protein
MQQTGYDLCQCKNKEFNVNAGSAPSLSLPTSWPKSRVATKAGGMTTGKDPQNLANLGWLNIGCHPDARVNRHDFSEQTNFIYSPLTFDLVGCRNYQVHTADQLNLLSVAERR